jgi:hypothetical protein
MENGKGGDSPARNILRILTVARAVGVSNLEYCADRAPILSSDAFQTDVILPTIVGMSVSREGAGVSKFSRGGT